MNAAQRQQGHIRLLIVEDQGLVREGLARILDAESDLQVVAGAVSLEEAFEVLSCSPVDVVLLDYTLGSGERGSSFLPRARSLGFAGKVLVVTASLSDPEALELLQQGISGIFHKQGSPELLAKAVRKVVAGEYWLDQHYLKLLMESRQPREASREQTLQRRELDVLRGVFQGLANKEIAARMQVPESTVKSILQQLFQKTGVRTRGQLVRIGMEKYRDQL